MSFHTSPLPGRSSVLFGVERQRHRFRRVEHNSSSARSSIADSTRRAPIDNNGRGERDVLQSRSSLSSFGVLVAAIVSCAPPATALPLPVSEAATQYRESTVVSQRRIEIDRSAIEGALQRKFANRLHGLTDDQLLALLMQAVVDDEAPLSSSEPTPPTPSFEPAPTPSPSSSSPPPPAATPSAPIETGGQRITDAPLETPPSPATEELLGIPGGENLFPMVSFQKSELDAIGGAETSGGSVLAMDGGLEGAITRAMRVLRPESLRSVLSGAAQLVREAKEAVNETDVPVAAARLLLWSALPLTGSALAARWLLLNRSDEEVANPEESREETAKQKMNMERGREGVVEEEDLTIRVARSGEVWEGGSSPGILWSRMDEDEVPSENASDDIAAAEGGGGGILLQRSDDGEETGGEQLATETGAVGGGEGGGSAPPAPSSLMEQLTEMGRTNKAGVRARPQPARGVMDNVEALPQMGTGSSRVGGRGSASSDSRPQPPQRPSRGRFV